MRFLLPLLLDMSQPKNFKCSGHDYNDHRHISCAPRSTGNLALSKMPAKMPGEVDSKLIQSHAAARVFDLGYNYNHIVYVVHALEGLIVLLSLKLLNGAFN